MPDDPRQIPIVELEKRLCYAWGQWLEYDNINFPNDEEKLTRERWHQEYLELAVEFHHRTGTDWYSEQMKIAEREAG